MDRLQELVSQKAKIKYPGYKLPTLKEIEDVEDVLSLQLPPIFKEFLIKYSNYLYGNKEIFDTDKESSSYIVKNLYHARAKLLLPEYLIPFVRDNGDYFCFDYRSSQEDKPVVFWSHDEGETEEEWGSFTKWFKDVI